MRIEVLALGILFAGVPGALRAGMVATLSASPESTGKVSFTASAIQVETSTSPVNVDFSDVLEADFSDTPFHLDSFISSGDTATQLPAGWKAQQFGTVISPGSVTYANGTFSLTGAKADPMGKEVGKQAAQNFFFVGRSWTGDGQWVAHLAEIDTQSKQVIGGLMMMDAMDAASPLFAIYAGSAGFGATEAREAAQPYVRGMGQVPMNVPIWFRVTRHGGSVDAAMSDDGKDWTIIGQGTSQSPASWIGFFVDSRRDRSLDKIKVDQVSFTPAPCAALVTPPGVILQSGSFLAGRFDHLSLVAAESGQDGDFNRNGSKVMISRAKIATVTMLPTSRDQFAAASAPVGLLMKNSDFMTGDFQSIDRAGVSLSSELLGPVVYNYDAVRACLLQPVQPQSAPYEVRLRDGSIIRATAVQLTDKEVVIQEVSGITVNADLAEIAQFRAGSARAQSLLEFPSKVTPLNPPTTASTTPPPPGAVPEVPGAPCWAGNNEEEVLATSAGTKVEFPLTGKFSGLAMRVALDSNSPPGVSANIRILADGREIGNSPPFRAGEAPRFLRISLQQPVTLAFQIESASPGTKVLLIDPTLIRPN
jgi:hypothetical protein